MFILPMTDPWCCYMWCAMDPINIPPFMLAFFYQHQPDPSWVTCQSVPSLLEIAARNVVHRDMKPENLCPGCELQEMDPEVMAIFFYGENGGKWGKLVGGLEHVFLSIQLGISSSQLAFIFWFV